MTTNWDDIKRLAADFQKVQLTSTLQRLSEHNCIEIVTLLTERKLVDCLFTEDGKEYVTPSQLSREIKDELEFRGGRVNIVDVSKTLNISTTQVSAVASEIVRTSDVKMILGQLISVEYIHQMAKEVNDKLARHGQIHIGDLTVQYNLPGDFIQHSIVEKHLGSIIFGQADIADPRIFFTDAFISNCYAKIKGALTAITQPIPVSVIITMCELPERIFCTFVEQYWAGGSLSSKQAGAMYIPNVYSKSQMDSVRSFYQQYQYLEYDYLSRLGISDPKGYINRHFSKEGLFHLTTAAVGPHYIDMIDSGVEECITSSSYFEIFSLLPTVFTKEDVEKLITSVSKLTNDRLALLFESTVLSTAFLNKVVEPALKRAEEKAAEYVESGQFQKYMAERQLTLNQGKLDASSGDTKTDRRDERRKKAVSGKVGGGTQGRETKTKSTKKHTRTNKAIVDSDDEDICTVSQRLKPLEMIKLEDLEELLSSTLAPDGLEYLAQLIAEHIHMDINKQALDRAQQLHEIKHHSKSQMRRQVHSTTQEKLNSTIGNIRLYDKGIKQLAPETQPACIRYLLDTLGVDIVNDIVVFVAQDCGLVDYGPTLTPKQWDKVVKECGRDYKAKLSNLIASQASSGDSVDDFITSAEAMMGECGMALKKADKKKDRTSVLCYKHTLLDKLSACEDPSLLLHLVVTIIFTVSTQCMLHISGKHISSVLPFLQQYLLPDQSTELLSYHELVLAYLRVGADSEEGANIAANLFNKMSVIRELGVNYKKPSSVQTSTD